MQSGNSLCYNSIEFGSGSISPKEPPSSKTKPPKHEYTSDGGRSKPSDTGTRTPSFRSFLLRRQTCVAKLVYYTHTVRLGPPRKPWRMGVRPEWANRWYEPTPAVTAALRAEAKFVADVWPTCSPFSIKPWTDPLSWWTHHKAVHVKAYNTFTAELVREGLDPSTFPRTFRGGEGLLRRIA